MPRRFRLLSVSLLTILVVGFLFFLSACSGGGSGRDSASALGGSDEANFSCDGSCQAQQLTEGDVQRILSQAIAGAQALNVNATFAVTDRVGNVLALYQMTGANPNSTIDGQIGANGGLEGVTVPSVIAAISKAGTGAYLSSQGNAFSTRTASQIVQEHFFPGEDQTPGGPLFGVQFSQLICGDVTVLNSGLTGGISSGRKPTAGGTIGPRPLPLGLSADPGGFPLYKAGDLVGGIGVEFDGQYSLDRNIQDFDDSLEERIALTASSGYLAPSERTANNMIVGGKALRYADISVDTLPSLDNLPTLEPSNLVALPFYSDGGIHSGAFFGDPSSGYANTVKAGVAAAVLVDGHGNARFPTRDGAALSGGVELRANEVDAILDSAIVTASRARAAIRTPLDSSARVSIFVIDTEGTPIGFIRTQDAPIFGTDVALQKARTAVFFSSADAAEKLNAVRSSNGFGVFSDYVSAAQAFLGPDALTGAYAITARAVGNLSRPFYPDGIDESPNGPFSHPFPGKGTGQTWSPFNDGLQLDLVFQRLAQPLGLPVNPPRAVPDSCSDERLGNRLRNGIQIFAGSVPLYRGRTLIGGIGISGDGIDQDDMIAFLGASRKGLDFVGHSELGDPEVGFNAPKDMRSDKIEPIIFGGTRLRYVNCPEGPFIGDNDQNQCDSQ